MANADRPNGFKPQGRILLAKRFTAGATIYPGDMVKLSADGKVDPVTAGDDCFGCALDYAVDGDKVLLSIHPEQLYVVQADTSEIDAQEHVGELADVLATAGDSTYRTSRHEINASEIAQGTSRQLVVLGVESRPDNAFGEFADVVVKINEHQIMGENDGTGI